jgi:hypothetical protein
LDFFSARTFVRETTQRTDTHNDESIRDTRENIELAPEDERKDREDAPEGIDSDEDHRDALHFAIFDNFEVLGTGLNVYDRVVNGSAERREEKRREEKKRRGGG